MNSALEREYSKVMSEMVSLGHAVLCEDDDNDGYYLPHHAVIKESSETTKVRPVYDASAKTSTGVSLNDILMVGPTIQDTVFQQLLQFRTHSYVITGDIEKMYRQVWIHPDDRKYQKFFWYHQGKICVFLLTVVTFGVAAAPFLAIRTLQQLAIDEALNFPRASKLLLKNFYVDDFLAGADTSEEISAIREEMTALLQRGGFIIRKWASNSLEVLTSINEEVLDLDHVVKEALLQKTLGVVWDSRADTFQYCIGQIDSQLKVTKRTLLSAVAKIFDPLGLLGPITMFAKFLIQDCWKSKVDWDESISQQTLTKWRALFSELSLVESLNFDRKIVLPDALRVEIHGFCDASRLGYGACLFVKSIDAQKNVLVRLLCSKSRVAPLSGLTIPRLELCAASILKDLYVQVRSQLQIPVHQVILYSDSSIVLCWLKKEPQQLKTFEANRVSNIQAVRDQVEWLHIRSEDNPADSLSRGQLPSEFIKNSLWKSGPPWLARDRVDWPPVVISVPREVPGLKGGVCLVATKPSSFSEVYSQFSCCERFVRVLAYASRWRKGSRCTGEPAQRNWEIQHDSMRTLEISKRIRPLTPSEIKESERKILELVQREGFSVEYDRLSKSSNGVKKGTCFDRLCPFISDNLIRVGSRLKNSKLPYGQQHPILLPQKHPVTEMVIHHHHEGNLHAGIHCTLYSIRLKFFILNGKSQIRKVIQRCVKCIRQRPHIGHAKMADLPAPRVCESFAFSHTGVDFFGPFNIKEKAHRNRSFIKTYGCVFICLASKAVHVELAIDLSTEGFLAAFRRFIARKGVPSHVYSDNGTNFVGANNELTKIYRLFDTEAFRAEINNYAISKRIEWHFNPPLSPHFGGLWEAAVKSFKHHLKRILDKQLTYEQFNTLLIEIEAILNSRPLYALSADPNDPLVLTPAHVLIGRPFNMLPEQSLSSVSENRLSTYQFLTKARQNFWEKWRKEYLHELQVRQKWTKSDSELAPGMVVLLIEGNVPSGQWPLGVIIEVHPGSDGVVRVASVKTVKGVFKRNVTR
ncbi:uncharacterized protein LOC131671111 [Phymastichus coffea]|uniref:uncharacterized protein LOC131671111 n=1 Tax=Phymastichus coffea TaxID=108790 RepID=UPI00273BACC9|nr:uncharacterized protein LOC131671111 [Phymastichus coffea]